MVVGKQAFPGSNFKIVSRSAQNFLLKVVSFRGHKLNQIINSGKKTALFFFVLETPGLIPRVTLDIILFVEDHVQAPKKSRFPWLS